MDKSSLILAVHRRTGVTLAPSDTAFAQAELIGAVLEARVEEAGADLAERLDGLPDRIAEAGKLLAVEIGTQGTQRIVEMLGESRAAIARETERSQQRIVEQFQDAARVLSRQVESAVRAAQSTKPNAYVHAHMLAVGAAIAIVFFALGALTSWSWWDQEASNAQAHRSGPAISRPRS